MTLSRFHRVFQLAVAAVLMASLASPGLAQKKKENNKKDQSEQAQKSIDKQKEIAKGLADKASTDPAVLQKQLDTLKEQLQAEKDRHAKALEKLNADLKAAGQGQKAKAAQKAIDRENEQSDRKVADLQKQIDSLQAKLDAGK